MLVESCAAVSMFGCVAVINRPALMACSQALNKKMCAVKPNSEPRNDITSQRYSALSPPPCQNPNQHAAGPHCQGHQCHTVTNCSRQTGMQ